VRDTGIYLGFVIALALLTAIHRRERASGFPAPGAWVLFLCLVGFMGWDGVTSYAGLRETTNELRLITGLGVGFSAAAVVFPMLNGEFWTESTEQRALSPLWRLALWLLGIPVSHVLISRAGPLLGIAFPLVIAFAILATYVAVNMVIVALLPPFNRRVSSWAGLVVPACIGLVLTLFEIGFASQAKAWLERVVLLLS